MKTQGRRSIFRSFFVPMILIMILQAIIFYIAAVYGGIEESLSRNASDILSERLNTRKKEVESRFINRWTELDDCVAILENQYERYETEYGDKPFVDQPKLQIAFLQESADSLINTLRYSETNGVFLILNDAEDHLGTYPEGGEEKYGLCIRDMDQGNHYLGREDLLLERSPASIIDTLGCSLDSWWEAKYSFSTEEEGDYYYAPLHAAWDGLSRNSFDLGYCSYIHQISGSDPKVVSYSIPLFSDDGYPFAVLGIELSTSYLSSLFPGTDLNDANKGCYVVAMQEEGSDLYYPVVGTGTLYTRCFGSEPTISHGTDVSTGGFTLTGRDGTELYAVSGELDIYNNNSPFESRRLVLLAMVESNALFAYIRQIKGTLMLVATLSLLLGVIALVIVSRRFASPITALAQQVRGMDESKTDYHLGRLGIAEIDQLVDSIEELNHNISRNSARTEFFSRMSHDMRTPMNAIISFSSPELLDNADEACKDDYLKKIHTSGIYLLGLINEVLDMTKIESNKTELNLTAVQANRLFDTTIPMIEKLAAKKSIRFIPEIDIGTTEPVMADMQHLNQVVMNLLSNAVKFTPAGGEVRISAVMHESTPAQLCRITVSDTGIGMSEEFLKRLYTPFAQENSNHEGTGLGLSIAKKLVELMHGTIACSSKPGAGTTFTVELPLPKAETAALPAQNADALPTADLDILRGKRALICEDNAINTTIIQRLLTRVGIETDTVENGKLGVERFCASPPGTYSVILMDIRMPVMDGLEASKAIRALPRADAADIPILAMTADAFAADAENSLTAGMNAHLTKPVEPQKLYDTLAYYLGQSD